MTEERARDRVTEICVGCRFGTGESRDCTLLGSGRLDLLVEQGPCRLDRRLKSLVKVAVDRDYPERRQQVSLLAEKAVFALMRMDGFPGEAISSLPLFLAFLERFARNFAIDALVAQGAAEEPRCGACRHFSGERGCTLTLIEDPAGSTPNPWHGDAVTADSKPRSLEPTCDAFALPSLTTVDVLGEVLGPGTEIGVAAVFRAIDALAGSSDEGLLEAILLRRHAVEGEDLETIAEQAEVPQESIAAILANGRRRLGDLLLPDAAS